MVVADTSPLNYLILLEVDYILPQLYGQVAVPAAVIRELHHRDAPLAVALWMSNLPGWLNVFHVRDTIDPALTELGAGEREAIVLAQDRGNETLLLIDEARGRSEAVRRGIVITGTLGVLDAAAEAGLLNLPFVIGRLRATSFHATPSLFKRLLDRDIDRRRPPGSLHP